jgi:hypothetical protein
MYSAFSGIRNIAKTQTNVRMFLDDLKKPTGEFKNYVTTIFVGTMEVVTKPQVLTVWGDVGPLYVLPWYVVSMPSEGDSSLGKIKMDGNPNLVSTGVIRQNVSDQPYPGTLDAAVYNVFDIPGYGKLHNKYPVVVQGTVDAIPPYHVACNCSVALLFDENDNPRGMVGGRSLTILGPA